MNLLNRREIMYKRVNVSPYNAATSAYLRATYPAYFDEICQYGIDNPGIVPFVNADNDLVVSLVNMGLSRFVITSNATWIDTGLSMPYGFKFKSKIEILGMNSHNVICGAHGLTYPYKRNMIGFHNGTWWLGLGNADENGGNYSIGNLYVLNGSTKKQTSTLNVDGDNVIASANDEDRSARNLYLFANNNSSSGATQFFNGKAEYAQIYDIDNANTLLRNYVPFNNDGVGTMLDIENLQIADLYGVLQVTSPA